MGVAMSVDLVPANDGRLANVLCMVCVDPSTKFGGIEEQTLVLAQKFKGEGRVFLPVYHCPGRARRTIEHQAAGLPCEFMDFDSFRLASVTRLSRLIRRYPLEWPILPGAFG